MTEQRFLGDILVKRGVVAPERLDTLYAVQREKGADLVDLLVNANVTDETTIARALAAEAELPYVDQVEPDKISTALATRIPIAFAKSHKMLVRDENEVDRPEEHVRGHVRIAEQPADDRAHGYPELLSQRGFIASDDAGLQQHLLIRIARPHARPSPKPPF